MSKKKPTFIPSTPSDLPKPSPAEICLKNVRYLRRAAELLEQELLAGVVPSSFVSTRIFEAARSAGTAVSAIKPIVRETEKPPCP